MSKINLKNFNQHTDWDDLDEEFGGTEKIKRTNEKSQKNYNEEDIRKPQGLPAGWREGDSFIGMRKKARR
mgnify:CR=1 FL=1|tara:strand:+ start:1317 stop:1526 length:210 start_codon:yes stop_codon:yes gene_type:complete